MKGYPVSASLRHGSVGRSDYAGLVVPLELVVENRVLAFFTTTTVFGTPVDITFSELALESFFPADTMTALRQISAR